MNIPGIEEIKTQLENDFPENYIFSHNNKPFKMFDEQFRLLGLGIFNTNAKGMLSFKGRPGGYFVQFEDRFVKYLSNPNKNTEIEMKHAYDFMISKFTESGLDFDIGLKNVRLGDGGIKYFIDKYSNKLNEIRAKGNEKPTEDASAEAPTEKTRPRKKFEPK